MTDERTLLRSTFNWDALLYDRARPGYPEELFDDIVVLSGIPDGGRILEFGCGTGIATLPLARRGFELLCVELGENLAAVARKNLASFPDVQVRVEAFEDWPVEEDSFDLAFAATAFHWLEPEPGYRKFAQALKPGGSLALFRHEHVHSDQSASFFEEVQAFYEEAGLAKESDFRMPRSHEIADDVAQITGSGLFGPVEVRRYAWDIEYDAASYIRLLNTYSGHINLDDVRRERLFTRIANLISSQPSGRITKGYMSILHVARRK